MDLELLQSEGRILEALHYVLVDAVLVHTGECVQSLPLKIKAGSALARGNSMNHVITGFQHPHKGVLRRSNG